MIIIIPPSTYDLMTNYNYDHDDDEDHNTTTLISHIYIKTQHDNIHTK